MQEEVEEPDAFVRAIKWFLWHTLLGLSPLIVIVLITPVSYSRNELYLNLMNEGVVSFFAAVVCGVVWIEFTFSHSMGKQFPLIAITATMPMLALSLGIAAIWQLHNGREIDISWHGPLQLLLFFFASAYSVMGKTFLFAEEIGTHTNLIECEKSKHA